MTYSLVLLNLFNPRFGHLERLHFPSETLQMTHFHERKRKFLFLFFEFCQERVSYKIRPKTNHTGVATLLVKLRKILKTAPKEYLHY
uniref:Uncharacterized protein n=1 Tax=Chlorella vulgaris TaxID=3077 RepID=A0A8A2F5F0_CHLVU|nr:hypothetical protein [Chlorella vulgaris]